MISLRIFGSGDPEIIHNRIGLKAGRDALSGYFLAR